MGQPLLYRNVLMMTLAGGVVLGAVLVVLVVMSWRSVERMEPLNKHMFLYVRLERVYRVLTNRLTATTETPMHNTQSVTDTASVIQALARENGYLYRRTPDKLQHAANLLLSEQWTDLESQNRLPLVVQLLREITQREGRHKMTCCKASSWTIAENCVRHSQVQ
jgi:hypothetical protein